MTAQRGDFDSPTASSPTARRDADDATFAAAGAEERGQGICRTCLAPIWNEGGTVHHRKRAEGWSDRIERGGDSLVCFKAVDYRHVPLTGREAAIYDRAYARGTAALKPAPGTDTPDQAVQRVLLDSPGELLPGDVVVQVEWDDATEWQVVVDRRAVVGPQRDHEARAREVLLPEVFAAERDRFAAPGTDSSGQAVQRVLALHRPWYEVGGARHDNTVTVPCSEFAGCGGNERVDCPESDGDGHEVLACYECRCVVDYDIPGHLLWPCPTVRAVAGPQRDHGEQG